VKTRFHWNAAHGVREDSIGMTVYNTVDVGELFVDLAVNEAFLITFLRTWINYT